MYRVDIMQWDRLYFRNETSYEKTVKITNEVLFLSIKSHFICLTSTINHMATTNTFPTKFRKFAFFLKKCSLAFESNFSGMDGPIYEPSTFLESPIINEQGKVAKLPIVVRFQVEIEQFMSPTWTFQLRNWAFLSVIHS